jgi:hypothetical protein
VFPDDDPSGVNPEHAGKLRNILVRLSAARIVADMDLPGFRLHALKSEMKGFWAVRVRAKVLGVVLWMDRNLPREQCTLESSTSW